MLIKRTIVAFTISDIKVIIFSSFVFAFCVNGQNWPMVNGNKERSSWAAFETELSPPLKKTHEFSLNNDVSSGISCYDNMLFVSVEATPNRLVAFEIENGQELWHFEIPDSRAGVGLVPAINNSLVLCGGQHGRGLYGRLTGTEKWFKSVGSLYSKNPIIDDNSVYIVADSLYCLNISTGSTIWSYPFSENVTPAVDDDQVYVCGDRTLIALNKWNGEIAWHIPNSQRYYSSIALDDNFIYTCNNDAVIALDKQAGSVHWAYNIPDGRLPDFSTNAIAISDSFLCFVIWENTDRKSQLYTLDKTTGNYVWHHTFDSTGIYSPAIANDNVYAIDFTNKFMWGFDLKTGQQVFFDNSEMYIGQPIFANNSLFVGTFSSVCSFKNSGTRIVSMAPYSPQSFKLFPNYPNPFNTSTRFNFNLVHSERLNISVFNLSGARIKTIADDNFSAAWHTLTWDGTNDKNEAVPSGIYVLKLCNQNLVKSARMILLK